MDTISHNKRSPSKRPAANSPLDTRLHPRNPHRRIPPLRRLGAENPLPIQRRQNLAVQLLNRHARTALPSRDILRESSERTGAPDGEQGMSEAVPGAEAGHGRDVLLDQLPQRVRRQQRIVAADDEPCGRGGADVCGDEAGGGSQRDASCRRRRRRVVDGLDVLGDFVGSGEVQVGGLVRVAQGDVEGVGEGESVDEVFEEVLVCWFTIYARFPKSMFRRHQGEESGLLHRASGVEAMVLLLDYVFWLNI